MANMNVNKVIYGGDVLIDLTGDSVSADKVLKGITAHDKSGAKITGTCTFDSDTSEDTAAVAEILVGKTAHARGSKLTGTMKNNGAVKGIISTVAGEYTVPQGYHDGLYRENPVKSRNYEAVKSSKKWENVGNSYIIPALLLYRYSYI